MSRVVISAASFAASPSLIETAQTLLKGHECVLRPLGRSSEPAEVVQALDGAELAIVGGEPLGRDVLESLPGLRFLVKYGVGLDNICLEAAQSLGISVDYEPGVNRLSVAEYTLGLMLASLHSIHNNAKKAAEGTFHKNGGRDLSAMTIGILGLGNVGSALATLLRPFGSELLATDIRDLKGEGVKMVPLDTLVASSQVLTIHTPLTAATRGLIDAEFISRMPKDSYLVNTARGEIIDEDALLEALTSGHLAGAALDVAQGEPAPRRDLTSHPGVIYTCHSAGNSLEAVARMGEAVIRLVKKKLPSLA